MRRFITLIYFIAPFAFFSVSPLWSQETSTLIKLEQDLKRLLDRVKPSVVTVSAQIQLGITQDGDLSFWKRGREEQPLHPLEITNVGSGIIYDSTHVISHISVIWDSKNISLTLSDGREIPAMLIGTDEDFGIAVLQTREKLGQAVTTSIAQPQSGNYVTIVGNALGASPAVSLGIVNAVRSDGMIQLSANIVAGNAGGPVFNSSGRLIGLLAGFISPGNLSTMSSYYSEPALAYPSGEIFKRVEKMISDQSASRGWVGVTAEDWPGVKGWIHISEVKPGSPAQEAGLRIGDIVVQVNGERVSSSMELAQYIRRHHPGGEICLGVLRGDSLHTVNMTIGDAKLSKSKRPYPETAQSTSIQYFRHFNISPTPSPAQMEQKELLLRINKMEKDLMRLRAMVKNR
ncbi:trypsin-like peptidase domain-containing protein [candidate division KSB1 bacterium]|nr:trypsin-like peptidase domain-containing protein [candidate division KSB1 bacterium]